MFRTADHRQCRAVQKCLAFLMHATNARVQTKAPMTLDTQHNARRDGQRARSLECLRWPRARWHPEREFVDELRSHAYVRAAGASSRAPFTSPLHSVRAIVIRRD